jgi:hypothetical protein
MNGVYSNQVDCKDLDEMVQDPSQPLRKAVVQVYVWTWLVNRCLQRRLPL